MPWIKTGRFEVERDQLDFPVIRAGGGKRGCQIVVKRSGCGTAQKAAAAIIQRKETLPHLQSAQPAGLIALLQRLLHGRNDPECVL